jgi:glycosyltransferase involved in cell wall biosynthesis
LRQILIDVSMLVNNLRKKQKHFGMFKVSIAYLRYFLNEVQVVFHIRKKLVIMPKHISYQIAVLILEQPQDAFSKIFKLFLKGLCYSNTLNPKNNNVLLKVDYSGFNKHEYFENLKTKDIQLIGMIHDLIPILDSDFNNNHQEFLSNKIFNLVKESCALLTVAKSTEQEIKNFFLNKQLDLPKLLGIPLGLSLEQHIHLSSSHSKISSPYFVMIVAGFEPRKNLFLMLQIWKKLAAKHQSQAPKLLVMGMLKKYPHLPNVLQSDNLKNLVEFANPSDEELQIYLKHARALLFPSFAEGFGLPLIEALGLGVPVIASDLDVFKEIAGDVPEYLSPIDGLGWMRMIEHYMDEHSELRQAQLQRMKGFNIPTWQEHFIQLELFLEQQGYTR